MSCTNVKKHVHVHMYKKPRHLFIKKLYFGFFLLSYFLDDKFECRYEEIYPPEIELKKKIEETVEGHFWNFI